MILPVCVLHLPSHHSEELREVNGAVAIRVHLIDHILELKLSGILTESPDQKKWSVKTHTVSQRKL